MENDKEGKDGHGGVILDGGGTTFGTISINASSANVCSNLPIHHNAVMGLVDGCSTLAKSNTVGIETGSPFPPYAVVLDLDNEPSGGVWIRMDGHLYSIRTLLDDFFQLKAQVLKLTTESAAKKTFGEKQN